MLNLKTYFISQASHSPSRRLGLTLLLGINLTLSLYLTKHFYELQAGGNHFQSACQISQFLDCDSVTHSRYAECLPGIPLAALATGWFLTLFLLTCLASSPSLHLPAMSLGLGLTTLGLLIQMIYLGIMLSILKHLCLFCLGVDLVQLVVFFLFLSEVLWQYPSQGPSFFDWFFKQLSLKIPLVRWGLLLLLFCLVSGTLFMKLLWEPKLLSNAEAETMVQAILSTPPVATLPVQDALPLNHLDLNLNPQKKILILEFSDFECPYCRQGALTLHQISKLYQEQVTLFFRNFPLPQHPSARNAAKAALCGQEQGKFQQLYEYFFENPAELPQLLNFEQPGLLTQWSKSHGIEPEPFLECLHSPRTELRLLEDMRAAESLEVHSTPTFFINGYRILGVPPLAVWKKLIQHFLSQPEP